jgi:YidC/Oxa1 family membrane protein insertase
MQDQAKRLLLAVGLALLVMVAWSRFFSPPPPPPPAAKDARATGGSGAVVDAGPKAQKSTVGTLVDGTTPAAAPAEAEQRITLEFPALTAVFSSRDAALVSWKLEDAKYLRDPYHGEIVAPGPGLLLVNFARSTFAVPAGATWRGERVSDAQVRYRYRSDSIEVVKTFTIHPKSYLVTLSVEVTAQRDAQQRLAITVYDVQDPKVSESGRQQARAFISASYANGEVTETPYSKLKGWSRQVENVRWTGFDHPYLLVAVAPTPKSPDVQKFTTTTEVPGGIQTDLLFPPALLRANEPFVRDVVAYIGPKYYAELEGADKVAGFSTGFKESVDLGWFKVIGRPLLTLLQFLHGLVGNWGIAIILLTVLVKAATLYWTTKSMRSMKAMAVLGPKMKELQAKYGQDRAKVQEETMALYKHHGVNPLAGCLPIFLQMPIWFALYRMLSTASELYLQPFVGGWIGDLTSRDPFYILPVVVTATMFLQSRLQPVTGDSAQQKMMMYGMPLMFGFMGLFFPAGLSLYMFTNTVLSALHSLYMNKFDKQSLAMAAKLKEATDKAAKNSGDKDKPMLKSNELPRAVVKAAAESSSDGDSAPGGEPATRSKEPVASRSNSKRKRRR